MFLTGSIPWNRRHSFLNVDVKEASKTPYDGKLLREGCSCVLESEKHAFSFSSFVEIVHADQRAEKDCHPGRTSKVCVVFGIKVLSYILLYCRRFVRLDFFNVNCTSR